MNQPEFSLAAWYRRGLQHELFVNLNMTTLEPSKYHKITHSFKILLLIFNFLLNITIPSLLKASCSVTPIIPSACLTTMSFQPSSPSSLEPERALTHCEKQPCDNLCIMGLEETKIFIIFILFIV